MELRMWSRRMMMAALLASGIASEAVVAAAGDTTAAVMAEVAGVRYEGWGPAECRTAPDGSIYDVPASMWHASFDNVPNPLSRVNVTIWQPHKGGPAQVTLAVGIKSQTYEIVTIPGRMSGRATGRFERLGAGGNLIVEGTTAAGQSIRVRVLCNGFLPAEDNG